MAFTLRTDTELEAALTTLAQTTRLSRQEIVRRALLEKLERNHPLVDGNKWLGWCAACSSS